MQLSTTKLRQGLALSSRRAYRRLARKAAHDCVRAASTRSSAYVEWEGNVATSTLQGIETMGYDPLPLFHDLVSERFAEFGEDIAIIDGTSEETRNYVELMRDRDAVAAPLQSLNLADDQVVGILSSNHCDYFAAVMGSLRAGTPVTPLNPVYTANEVAKQLQGSNTAVLWANPASLDVALEAARASSVKHVFVLGDQDIDGITSLRSLVQSTSGAPSDVEIALDHTAVLPYSSGTTGLPKGTMLTHYNLTANLLQSRDLVVQDRREDGGKVLSPLPMFHIYAFMVSLMGSVWQGLPLITMQQFDFPRYLELIQEHRVTRTQIVPPIALGLAKLPIVDDYDLSSCTHAMCAAAPLTTEVQDEVAKRLGMTVKQGWGMSELSPLGTVELDDMPNRSGSVGPPCANTSVKVVDLETGAALPPGEEGELCVKGPQVMKGYLNEPEKTAECITADGWFSTGDIAKMDDDGFVYITDRLKELIKYKGFQVAPAELEGVICSHPAVQDATVIPVPDEEAGELPRAYIVVRPGIDQTDDVADSIQEFVTERVSKTKKLRGGIVFTDAIPKTASGKILRREVIAMDRRQA